MANNQTDTKREAAIKATTQPMYRNQIIESNDWSGADGGALTLNFANGEELFLTTATLTNGLLFQATIHGLKQKLVDAAAISRNPDTGRSATIADKYEAVKAVYDRLLSGMWNEPREGGGHAGGLLLRALCRMQPGKTVEQLKTWLEGKTDKEKAALRANPKVAKVIDEIRSETVKTDDIDTDELLNQLDD